MQGKKAAYITARGGSYTAPHMEALEQGARYVRTLFTFFGIADFETIACENTNVLEGEARSTQISACIKQAQAQGAKF